MRHVLIAGCGYVGAAAADLFQKNGWEVEGWTRSAESRSELSRRLSRVRAVDISNPDEVQAAGASTFDVVIHCASTRGGSADSYREVYWHGARNLLARFVHSHLIFTSSTSVYAQNNEQWVGEDDTANPNTKTGQILRDTEEAVLDTGGTVARFGGIYGPGRSALLQKLLNGKAFIDRENDRFVNEVHRDDAAAALLVLAGNADAHGQIYNVVDGAPIRQSECFRWLAQRLNRELPEHAPGPVVPRKRGQSNKRISNAKLRAVGWRPVYATFADGMEKSVLPSFVR